MASSTVSIEAGLYVLLRSQSEELWGGSGVNFADGPRGFIARHEEVLRVVRNIFRTFDFRRRWLLGFDRRSEAA